MARDLLKIDRGAKALKEGLKEGVSKREEEFFSAVNKFVNGFEEELVHLHANVSETQDLYKKMLETFGERPMTDSEEVRMEKGRIPLLRQGYRRSATDTVTKDAKLLRATKFKDWGRKKEEIPARCSFQVAANIS